MRYVLSGKTDRGLVREHNEDAVDWFNDDETWALAVVADGMGGYCGGEVASSLTVDMFVQLVRQHLASTDMAMTTAKQAAQLMRAAAASVNRRIKLEQSQQPALSKMGTTLVAGLVWRNYLSVIHAGDSRCYRWSNHKLSLLTRDHTYVEEMMARGDINREDASEHPYRHVLTRALGSKEAFEFTVTTHEVKRGDCYLFCSDGLYNTLSTQQLRDCLAQGLDPAGAAGALIQSARDLKANDNITAVVLNCD